MKLTLDQALQKGIEAHKAGKVQEADKYYTAILKANPKHSDANHRMGILAVGVGKIEISLPFFKTALEGNPKRTQYWLSYIDALIKLDRKADAKAVFDQAKNKGAKGDAFDQIEPRLNTHSVDVRNETQEDIRTAPNILDELKLDKALKLADRKVKNGLNKEAKKIYKDILKKFPKNKNAVDGIKILARKTLAKTSDIKEPSKDQFQGLVYFYNKGQYQEALNQASQLLNQFPNSINLYNIIGAANKNLGKLDEAIEAYNKALAIKPDYADAFFNMAIALIDQGNLEDAIEAYNKALTINPDNAEVILNASSLRNQLTDTALIRKEFEKKLEIQSHDLITRPKFHIHKAIRAFLLPNQELVRKHLNIYNGFTSSSVAKLTPKDKEFCSAYNIFLQKLIEVPFENEATFAEDQTVFHLGESHCLSYAHKKIKLQGMEFTVSPRITFGGKAYHFSKEKDNSYKAITKSNFDSLPDGSKVFVSFGEIDCRQNEGFIYAAAKHKKPIENLVSGTVKGYFDWFYEQNHSKQHCLFFLNVPAPIFQKNFSSELNKETARVVKLFNNAFANQILNYNFGIIDVYKFTVGNNGLSNGLFHIDNRHISSAAIPEIEKQIGTL